MDKLVEKVIKITTTNNQLETEPLSAVFSKNGQEIPTTRWKERL